MSHPPKPPGAAELLHLEPILAARERWAWGDQAYGDFDTQTRDEFAEAYEESLDLLGYLEHRTGRGPLRQEAFELQRQLYPLISRLRELTRRSLALRDVGDSGVPY